MCNPLIFSRQDQREDATRLRGRSVRGFAFQCEDHCRTLVPWIWWEKWRFRGCVSLGIRDLQWWINDEIIVEIHLCIIEGFARFEEYFVLSRGCVSLEINIKIEFLDSGCYKTMVDFPNKLQNTPRAHPRPSPKANYERNPFRPHYASVFFGVFQFGVLLTSAEFVGNQLQCPINNALVLFTQFSNDRIQNHSVLQ